jgi:large subunit ribosomal protein L20
MRVKRGVTKSRKHKSILKATKGYRGTFHRLFKKAHEAYMHAGQYNFIHRRHRRGQMRNQWIKIIAAALSAKGLSYSKFIHGMGTKGIILDRKVLAEIAQTNPAHFATLVDTVS